MVDERDCGACQRGWKRVAAKGMSIVPESSCAMSPSVGLASTNTARSVGREVASVWAEALEAGVEDMQDP
jgi:hypothetical protein